MSYVLKVLKDEIEPVEGGITPERFLEEEGVIHAYLGRLVNYKVLALYRVLFHMSYYETGFGFVEKSVQEIGGNIMSLRGNLMDYSQAIRDMKPVLIEMECITVEVHRGRANKITVRLPSEIPAVKQLMRREREKLPPPDADESENYFNSRKKRLVILERDKRRCMYCRAELDEKSFCIDHLVPVSRGGSHRKNNLVACCKDCNTHKKDKNAVEFLKKNYREGLLGRDEFIAQKTFIEKHLALGMHKVE